MFLVLLMIVAGDEATAEQIRQAKRKKKEEFNIEYDAQVCSVLCAVGRVI